MKDNPNPPLIQADATLIDVADARCNNQLHSLLERAVRDLRGKRGFLALVDQDTGELVVQYTSGEGWDETVIQRRLRIGQQEGRGITAFVAASGVSYRTGDVTRDAYYVRYFEDVRSEVAVPLVDAFDRVIGVINIESERYFAFDDRDELYLESLGAQAALCLSMADRLAREHALIDVANQLALSVDAGPMMQRVVDTASRVLRADDCSLFLINHETRLLSLRASRGTLGRNINGATYKLGEGLTGSVALEGRTVRTEDPRLDTRWKGLHNEFPPEELGSYLAVPIHGQSHVIGVLRVVRKRRCSKFYHHAFTEDDEGLLLTLASQIGVAVENSRLRERLLQTERLAAWGEMSARSAHMLGNRLFAMSGYVNELSHLVTCRPIPPDQAAEMVEGLKRGVGRLAEILAEFRDFVLATKLARTPASLSSVVRESVEEGIPPGSDVRLELELAEDLPNVCVDVSKLKRCFTELIENSISLQGQGGSLTVRCRRATDEDLKAFSAVPRSRKYAAAEFQDSGPGVKAEDKTRIFTPFFTTRAKGMGLGLAIVKGIVEAHGGAIQELGEPGAGARFLILLPLERDDEGC
ncbi:MAG TPA: GAF domain-containing protein [Armatimonadota bacterium]|jgi:signal transduction histidine kinase